MSGSPAPARGPDVLLPVSAARLAGFVALGSLAALEWQRLVAGLGSARALLWVLAAALAGAAVIACDRLPARRRGAGGAGAAAAGLLLALAVSGLDLHLLRTRHWDELAEGLAGGALALGTVALPYAGADPWPAATLEVLGAVLLTAAALLACWPRADGRGYPFHALIVLLVLVVSPVVSLGAARPLVLGAAIAALTVAFLWLERLPLRPGLGVAALLGVALAGALPLAAMADRGEPWFDYRAFAEGLGADRPVRFDWTQGYGPVDWPRDGNEIMRVRAAVPQYWKVADLEVFDGRGWAVAPPTDVDLDRELPDEWRQRPGWSATAEVSVRRLRTRDVPAPGVTLDVRDATRPARPSSRPGRWVAPSELRWGDSYTVEAYVPRPSAPELREASSIRAPATHPEALELTVPLPAAEAPEPANLGSRGSRRPRFAVVRFPPLGAGGEPFATYPELQRTQYAGASALRRSRYARTWRLAQRLAAGAGTPYEYLLAVDAFLERGFTYTERPPAPARGVPPLEAFLHDDRAGYCQHFAGGMALLLRMGGVPARVATGFSPGGFSERRDAWVVRDKDAHAWVEVWFDGIGWVPFDPTPASTPARSQIAALAAPATPAPAPTPAAGDASGAGGASRAGGVRPDLLADRHATDEAGGGARDGSVPWWAAALAAAAAAAAAALALRRRHGSGAAPASAADRAVAELEAALRRSGRPVPRGTTLRQLEHRLGSSPDAVAYLRALSRARYGDAGSGPTGAERRALRRALAEGLGLTGRVRGYWALPPLPPLRRR